MSRFQNFAERGFFFGGVSREILKNRALRGFN